MVFVQEKLAGFVKNENFDRKKYGLAFRYNHGAECFLWTFFCVVQPLSNYWLFSHHQKLTTVELDYNQQSGTSIVIALVIDGENLHLEPRLRQISVCYKKKIQQCFKKVL